MTRKMVDRMICRQTGGEVWGIIGMSSRIVSRQGNENRILLARTPGRHYRRVGLVGAELGFGNETSLTSPPPFCSLFVFLFFLFPFSLSLHFATNAVSATLKLPIRKMEPLSIPGRRPFDDIVGQESGYLYGETRPCRISHATTSRVCSCS